MASDLAEYERIKERIGRLGLAISGTIRETYLMCGKPACACAVKADARHGPYYLWNRKVDGRLTSKSISKDRLSVYEEWIGNRRALEVLVQKLLEIGSEIAINPPQQSPAPKSNQRASSTRGK